MRASPRADDMRPRPRRAAGLPEVQEGWQAPGCNAAPACPALAPAAAAGKLNAKLKSDFRCYPNNGHAATASAGPFCANKRHPLVQKVVPEYRQSESNSLIWRHLYRVDK